MTKSFLVTLTIFLGICSLAASTNTIQNPLDDTALFYNIFKDWINLSNKKYGIEEMAFRYSNWKSNYDYVQEHNAHHNLEYTLEMNDYADLSSEEFSALHFGLNLDLLESSKNLMASALKNATKTNTTNTTNSTNSTNASNSTNTSNSTNSTNSTNSSNSSNTTDSTKTKDGLPRSVDWRKAGAVTSVKNQGTCGGCYAFAAAGALEGLYAIKSKQLTDISVQQMIDCSGFFGNQGCDGGLMTTTFGFTQLFGAEPEHGYSYAASLGYCRYNSQQVIFRNTGHEEVTPNDYMALKRAVVQQPVSVGIEASSLALQLFKKGILSSGCGTALNHAVLIVGYDVDKNGQEYWIAKNSWGEKWGQKGYFNIAMGNQNNGAGVCGINMMASYPTL